MSSNAGIVRESAPAKINLFLHIVGRRDDGLHLVDSLVAFADVGDAITARADAALSLDCDGPMTGLLPPDDDNLVLRAASLLREQGGVSEGARIELTKNLPVASGIGGGSADAAAALRALNNLWRIDMPADDLRALASELGADVPVCLAGVPARVGGVGDELSPAGPLAPLYLVLANPGVAVPTADVFAAFAANPISRDPIENEAAWSPVPAEFAAQLAARRNDLSEATIGLYPSIGDVLAELATQRKCLLARMSGSGATCFGLFADAADAQATAAALQEKHAGWWVVASGLAT